MAALLTLSFLTLLVANAMLNDGFNQEQLALLANVVQIFNYIENAQQTSNDRIMMELQRQNKIYLETSIKQNNEIIERLQKLEDNLKEKENVRFKKS